MRPSPKHVSSDAKVEPTLFGNSEAIMLKEAVKNAAFPKASMIRTTNAAVMNRVCPGILSSNPNTMAAVPVVKIPALNIALTPMRFM